MRESAAAKAVRLLAEGRVAVLRVTPSGILAQVRGDTAAFYWVEYNRRKASWSCSCPAIGRCSHALAVQKVVVTEGLQLPLELVNA